MNFTRTDRGFGLLEHEEYPGPRDGEPKPIRLAQHSSVILDYDDAFQRPGTSALWIGANHHLNREQVAQLVRHLQSWLDTGSLEIQ